MTVLAVDKAKLFDFVGRVLFSFVFAQAVPGKVAGFPSTVEFIVSRGIPEPLAAFLLGAAILVLIAGSISFVFAPNTRLGASLLLLFLVPTTLIFHTFPVDAGLVRNLALIGGLVLAITRSTAGATPSFKSIRQKPQITR